MDFDRAVSKVLRWAQKRDSFTRQQAWQANKNGSIKTSADLETVLRYLVENDWLVISTAENERRTAVYSLPEAVIEELQLAEPDSATTSVAPRQTHPAVQPSVPKLATVTPISAANKEPLTPQELSEIRSWPRTHPLQPRSRMILMAALERMGHGFGLSDLRPSHFTVAEAVELQRMVRGA